MPDEYTPAAARRQIAELLEPRVFEAARGADITSIHQLDRLATLSQAVSLRRIADALQPQSVEHCDLQVVHLSEETLEHLRGIASGMRP